MRKREKKRRGFLGWLRAVFALVLVLALLAAGLVLIPLTEREDKSVVEARRTGWPGWTMTCP